jgi:adenylyltransferase/sulfurtransferase
LEIIQNYDLVLDCTDHPRVRYLVSDAAVIAAKTVVSASALKTEGQLVVVNKPEKGSRGPCYRCYWPKPPPRESVVSCGEGGVLGPVVGVMGVLQALEAVKIIASGALENQQPPASAEEAADGAGASKPEPAPMLFFSSYSPTPFKTLRMKGRRADCISCGHPSDPALKITASTIPDYDDFCGPGPDAVLLDPKDRRTVKDVEEMMGRENVVVVDTRDETQFGITSVGGSKNVPFVLWQRGGKVPEEFWRAVEEGKSSAGNKGMKGEGSKEVIILCRRGNDSQEAAKMVMEDPRARDWKVTDVVGGIGEWAKRLGGVVEY